MYFVVYLFFYVFIYDILSTFYDPKSKTLCVMASTVYIRVICMSLRVKLKL